MKLPFFWIDAFTSRVFSGNPAAVVPLETWLADAELLGIARQNNLSETAFFIRTGPAHYHLRWFTPAIEVDLCGHATLASGYALFTELGETSETITFDSRSGPLTVTRRNDILELNFPSQPPSPCAATPELIAGLRATPTLVLTTGSRLLCVFPCAQNVKELKPNFAAMKLVTPGRIIVTAPGEDCDFVSRFFAPDAGIDEDPVTGSAHCVLTPYWATRLGKTHFHARQLSERGGELWCELRSDRVAIAGACATYLRGEIVF